jgi:hypothetical protein
MPETANPVRENALAGGHLPEQPQEPYEIVFSFL